MQTDAANAKRSTDHSAMYTARHCVVKIYTFPSTDRSPFDYWRSRGMSGYTNAIPL